MKEKKKKWLRCLCSFLLMISFVCTICGNVEKVYAEEAMMSKSGYFYIKIVGADGDVTLQKVNVTYEEDSHEETQDVAFSLPNKGKNNPHNLKVTGTEDDGTSPTKKGATSYPEKSLNYNHEIGTVDPDCPVLLKDGTVTTYSKANKSDIKKYKEDCYTVFNVTVSYDKEAYTYETGDTEGNDPSTRLNARKYNWYNAGDSTLSKKVYHQTQRETFNLQVNIAQTGVYTDYREYHGTYVVNLHHPTLEITYDGNGATSGSTSGTTHKITYNNSDDPYNFSTFALKKTDYVKNTGAEWNTNTGGTGTSFNQETSYSAIQYKNFTDGEVFTKKTLTLYAQWKAKPSSFGIYLHANSPTGYVASWWMSGNWCHNSNNWPTDKKAADEGAAYYGLTNPYMYKQYSAGKSYTLPQANGNIGVAHYVCVATGWYTAPVGGDYIEKGAIEADDLLEYVGADGAVHLYAQWTGNTHTLTFDPNGGTVGTSSVTIKYGTGDYNNVSWNTPTRTGYNFLGWYNAATDGTIVYNAAGACTNEGTYWSGNVCVYDGDYTVYAHWEPSTYTVHFNGNGANSGSMSDMVCYYDTDYTLTPNAYMRTGYTFTGWNTAADGTGTAYKDKQSFKNLGDITLYAQWKINSYKVILHSGTGIKSVSGAGTYPYNSEVKITATVKDGYHWANWTGTYETDKIEYTFKMPAQDVEMTANAEANEYIIHFDPNDGTEVSHINDITVKYDEEVTLPNITLADGTDAYIKYTLDGVNVTEQILDGRIVIDLNGRVLWQGEEPLPEGSIVSEDGTITTPDGVVIMPDGTVIIPDGTITSPDGTVTAPDGTVTLPDGTVVPPEDATEESSSTSDRNDEDSEETAELELESETGRASEEPETEPQPDKKAYKSVFRGWSLEEERYSFIPQWEADVVISVNELVNAAGVIEQDGATITLYATWDDCPWIWATNLYYTLEQAQNGFITADKILSHATAEDREDGSPIAPGVHENGTSFTIPDYQTEDFTQLKHEGTVTENLTVVDSAGSKYVKQITVYIVDTTPVEVSPEGYTRFITRNYYDKSYEYGGLEEDSIWKTDPEYQSTLLNAFANIENDTPIMVFEYSNDDIKAMKAYIEQHDIGNSKEADALQNFYNLFMAPNQTR